MRDSFFSSCLCALLALAAGSSCAVDAVWVNSTDKTPSWRTLTNWEDESGAAVESVPLSTADSATFPAGAISVGALQKAVIEVEGTEMTWTELGLGGLTDENPHPRHAVSIGSSFYANCWEVSAWLTLLDPNRFSGYLTSESAGFGIRLPSTAGNPLWLAGISLRNHANVDVPTANTKATLGAIYEGGTLRKRGAGELAVEGSAGIGTQIHVRDGTLTLVGRSAAVAADPGDDVPVPGAWLHLDANRLDTMKTYVDAEDGRTYVTNWCDVRGNGVCAYYNAGYTPQGKSYLVATTHAPYVSDTAVEGRTVVDFGRSLETQDVGWGPMNCTLNLSSKARNVREAFCVACVKSGGPDAVVFGTYDEGDGYPFHPGAPYFFHPTYASGGAVNGDIVMNALPVGNAGGGWPNEGNIGVVSVGITNAVTVSALASERSYKNRVGGVQIAEAILFTNRLTHAERMLVHRYLQRKWIKRFSADEPFEVGAVSLASNDNSVDVPSGRIAAVQEVNAVGGTLVKTGGGTLVVGALGTSTANKNVQVDVRGGSVKFSALAVDDTAPAADAYLWLKAERDTMVISNKTGDVTDYVARWNDCRPEQTARYAQIPLNHKDYKPGKLATLVANAAGGRPAVDFGEYGANKDTAGAFMSLVGMGNVVYDAFVVHSYTTGANGGAVFGSSDGTNLYPGGDKRFLRDEIGSSPYGGPLGRNALWTFNGAVVDATASGQAVRAAGEWNVISVSSTAKLHMSYLGDKDRTATDGGGWGGCRVVETIYYNRPLSPAERRQTIAYLMKKWKGKTGAAGTDAVEVDQLSFPANEDAIIDTDRPMSVKDVEMSGETLVKRGSGSVVLEQKLGDFGASSLAVEGGVLSVESNPMKSILQRTALHYDASDVEKMEYFLTEDPGGAVRTNLVRVADQRDPEKYMEAKYNPADPAPSYTNPTLRVVQTAEGVERQVFDFGLFNDQKEPAATASHDTGYFALSPYHTKNIREAHVIYADTYKANGAESKTMDIFGDWSYELDYFRGGSGQLLVNNDYTRTSRAGSMAVDGELVAGAQATSYVLPRGFHLVSAFPAPSEKDASGRVTISAMANTHKCGVGGCQVGELIAFGTPLEASESAYLQRALMAKWLGHAAPVWTNAVANLSVAGGATLSGGPDDAILAGHLEGSGTIAFGRVVAGSLSLVAGEPLVVAGAFVQEGPLPVAIASEFKPDVGEYPILTAGSFEDLDLSAWNVTLSLSPSRTWTLVRSGDTVFLSVGKAGLTITIR